MPELMRSIVARFYEFVGHHGCAPRRAARLPLSVSLLDSHARPNGTHRPPTLKGHTRDLSETGLSLIVPSIRLGDRYLTGENRTLRITFELPSGLINLHAAPVRYELLDEDEIEIGYLIGAHITQMSSSDRTRFIKYLRTLR
ncbi:MAG TPA: PilZ domain-containing protein [Pyrinomonadaceae bacterium]|nr:PilZ domain-containing protein [Pyrinomonadaceae bacterium]